MAEQDPTPKTKQTPVVTSGFNSPTREAVKAQRDSFGGLNWGASFFGWLSANGLAVILVALATAAGVGLSLAQDASLADAESIGLTGGIVLLVLLAIAYFAGGYVAGRMSRFDGARQGLGVWLVGIVVAIILAATGFILGAQYNVLAELNLPRIPVDEGTATTAGLIALGAVLLTTLLASMLGGKVGERYHRKVDRAGFSADEVTA